MINLTPGFKAKSRLSTEEALERAVGKLDPSGMLKLLQEFPDQLAAGRKLKESPRFKANGTAAHILFSGLGGSAICGDLFRDAFGGSLKAPVSVNRDYRLPSWVGRGTVAILISYSGNTEETLAAYREAIARKAALGVVSSGGKLSELARKDRVPLVTVPAGYPPRAAMGYLFTGALTLAGGAGILKVPDTRFTEMLAAVRRTAADCGPGTRFQDNPARRLAAALKNTIPVVYAAAFLSGAATRWKTQIEENGKNLAFTGSLPEMNHNEVVGWSHPSEALRKLGIVFLRDRDDQPQVKKRFDITAGLLKPRHLLCEVEGRSKDPLARLFSVIVFGDWVSYYLALENAADPTPVARITRLKKELAGK